MGLTSVIEELEEQLRYAKEIDGPEGDYTVQLEKAIQILKEHELEEEQKMNELTLSGLLRVGESEYAKDDADFMLLKIEGATPEPEVIINPRKNFEAKLEYISKAYNEDLTLKNAPHIRIVNYDFVTAKQLVEDNILLEW